MSLTKKIRYHLLIQCLAMLAGTATHLIWILENGIYSVQNEYPFFSTLFWDSLLFLDLAAALLLILRPKFGLILTLIIIVTDVIHNLIVLTTYQQPNAGGVAESWILENWMFLTQVIFLVFVVAGFKSNWTAIRSQERRE